MGCSSSKQQPLPSGRGGSKARVEAATELLNSSRMLLKLDRCQSPILRRGLQEQGLGALSAHTGCPANQHVVLESIDFRGYLIPARQEGRTSYLFTKPDTCLLYGRPLLQAHRGGPVSVYHRAPSGVAARGGAGRAASLGQPCTIYYSPVCSTAKPGSVNDSHAPRPAPPRASSYLSIDEAGWGGVVTMCA